MSMGVFHEKHRKNKKTTMLFRRYWLKSTINTFVVARYMYTRKSIASAEKHSLYKVLLEENNNKNTSKSPTWPLT